MNKSTFEDGATINHYHILSRLEAGGMGEFYRANLALLDREVAIKVLPASLVNDTDWQRRFAQEAWIIAALHHPNIITIYEFGAHDGRPFMVIEPLEGENLRVVLQRGAIALPKAIDYARQVASALTAMHASGVVHRDLKPEILLITKDERVKLFDFILAKLRPLQPDGADAGAPAQKQGHAPGRIIGTVGYMSPEQMRGREADFRSDIFSFGVILYEMLTGRQPFRGASAEEALNEVLTKEPPELNETNAEISPELERIVLRCLGKQPERRFQSANDLSIALADLKL